MQPTSSISRLSKQETLPTQFVELMSFSSSAPLFLSRGKLVSTSCQMSILLATNKESMLTDPINWESSKNHLIKWSEESLPGVLVSIPENTNSLFNERSPLSHPPRVLSKQSINILLQSSSLINFFDAYAPKKSCIPKSLPPWSPDSSPR